jgi:hypothetical protein
MTLNRKMADVQEPMSSKVNEQRLRSFSLIPLPGCVRVRHKTRRPSDLPAGRPQEILGDQRTDEFRESVNGRWHMTSRFERHVRLLYQYSIPSAFCRFWTSQGSTDCRGSGGLFRRGHRSSIGRMPRFCGYCSSGPSAGRGTRLL